MIERLPQYLGLPLTIAATVALTWDTFSGLDLVPRLVATLILAVILQELLARALAPKRPRHVGFLRPDVHAAAPNRLRLVGLALLLAVAAALAAGLAWLQTEWLVVAALRGEQDGAQTLTMTAAWVRADFVEVPLPPLPVECTVHERGATLTMIDWAQPDRLLRVDDFVAPQYVSVTCATDTVLGQRGVQIGGPADGPYFEAVLRLIRTSIIFMGVLTWLYGVFRLRALS